MLLRKIVGIFFGLLFISFAVVQYNDPDTLLWVAIYLVAAVICVAAGFGKVGNTVLLAACLLYAVGVIFWWPEHFQGVGDSMRDATTGKLLKNVEEGRESLGLAMCSAAMLSLLLLSKFQKRGEASRAN